jgi:hypothetical protein
MFEQSIYDADPVAAPSSEGDLFHDYEITTWDLGPRIYKILAIAAVGNLLALLIVSQTSLLTMKGCDSPLVGRVCQALDTIYVGSMLLGTDREYVDAAYDKTELGDVDITFVDVSGDIAPLSYPEGYFQLANPESFQASLEQPADPFLTNTFPPNVSITPPSRLGSSLLDHRPNIPKPNNDIIDGPLPDEIGSTTPGKKPGKTKPTASPTPDETTAENPTVIPTGPVKPDDINTRPFTDLAMEVNELLDKKQLDLDAPVQVLATAKLAKDGKIAKGSFKVSTAVSSDKKLATVVAKAVAAFNDSNLLNYLKDLSGKDLSFAVQQDQDNIVAAVKSQVESDTRAQSMATALQFGISLIIQKKEKGIETLEAENDPAKAQALQNLRDDLELLKNTKVSANGKEFVVNFSAPKTTVHQMIQRKLAEQKAAPKTQNNNSISGKVADNTAKN